MNFDVVIVGAGPSGLSAGIRLAQLAQQQERELTICILEKAPRSGHIYYLVRCSNPAVWMN